MKITEPTLLLDEQVCRENIERMSRKVRQTGLTFKPHMKTHQSPEIGRWLKDAGVEAVTVSSVKMAGFFARHGWRDITIAFPCNIRQIEEIADLANTVTLTLLVNNRKAAEILSKNLTSRVNAYIEIDTGSGRTGWKISQQQEIESLIGFFDKTETLNWIGFYSHPGHSYQARSKEEILRIFDSVRHQAGRLKSLFATHHNDLEVCIGDTPCCSVAESFDDIDAISPGNFIFYDLMQYRIGSCSLNHIAVALACPVVDRFPDRGEIAISGGAIHFSKEAVRDQDKIHFGLPARKLDHGWEIQDTESYVKALSQEHGLIKCSDRFFNDYQVGDVIHVLPVHSCLTAHLMGKYLLTGGGRLSHMAGERVSP